MARFPVFVGIVLALQLLAATAAPAITLYVATTGSDAQGDGSESRPFATLQRARDALRAAKQKGGGQLPAGGAQVLVRQGTYRIANASLTSPALLELGAQDSGTAAAPITYSNYPGEAVRFLGGVTVPPAAFKPFRDNIVQADLSALGIKDFGNLQTGGLGQCNNRKVEVHFNGRPMVLARWPNIDPDGTWEWAQVQSTGADNLTIGYNGTRQAAWAAEAAAGTGWLHGFWLFDWADNYVQLTAVDAQKQELHVSPKTPFLYGVAKQARYYGVNLLCELDAPNEYYIDRQKGVLYLVPPAPIAQAEVVLAVAPALIGLSPSAGGWDAGLATPNLAQPPAKAPVPFVASEEPARAAAAQGGPAFITIEGFQLLYSASTAVVVNGATNVTLKNLTAVGHAEHGFSLQGNGLRLSGGTASLIGCAAISLTSGDIPSLRRGDSVIEDCKATNYSTWIRTYGAGIGWYGVGNTVRRTEVGFAPHVGMLGSGNDNQFSDNYFHDLCTEVSDSGAWYAGRTWAKRGNVISGNTFHNIRNTEKTFLGYPSVQAVYLDDQLSGHTIEGNTVTDSWAGILLGGGRRNIVRNNKFLRNTVAVHFDNRGQNWQKASCTPPDGALIQELEQLHYQQPPWSTHYPELVNVTQDHPCTPVYNQVVGNTWCCQGNSSSCQFIDASQASTDSWLSTVASNTYNCAP